MNSTNNPKEIDPKLIVNGMQMNYHGESYGIDRAFLRRNFQWDIKRFNEIFTKKTMVIFNDSGRWFVTGKSSVDLDLFLCEQSVIVKPLYWTFCDLQTSELQPIIVERPFSKLELEI